MIVVAGLVVHGLPGASALSDIAGDALYTALVYLGVVAVWPRWSPAVAGAVAAGWCVAVELFQLTGLPARWGAAWSPAALVFGSAFDARDLVVYVATAALVAGADAAGESVASALTRRRRSPAARR